MPYLQEVKTRLTAIPVWRRYLYGGILLAAVVYAGWCLWGSRAATPGSVVISAPIAPQIVKMETKTVYVPKLVVIKEKAEAVRKLGLPPGEASNPKEELLTATALKANRYGAVASTFVNTSTGRSRTDITYKKAPWFSFERTTYVGGSVGASTLDGYIGRVYLKRDLAQIKGVYVQLEGDGIIRPSAPAGRQGEGIGWINLEHRFDWP